MIELPIHVLQCTTRLSAGGVQTFLVNYAKHMDPTKVIFDFAVQTKVPQIYDNVVKSLGGNIYYSRPVSSQLGYFEDIKNICKKHSEIKIVHSHLNYRNYLPLLAAKSANVPVRISHSHSSYLAQSKLKHVARNVFQTFLPLFATDYWGCSQKANQWLYGKRANKAKVVNNAIETEKYHFNIDTRKRQRELLGIEDDCTAIVHVGTFGEAKNHEFLIKLFSDYHKLNQSSKLFLCGDGPLRPQIEKQIEDLNLETSVILLGMINDIPDVLMAADVFVFPSLYEGFSISLVEAESTGIPAVASTACIEADFNKNCIICEGFDSKKWIYAIERAQSISFERKSGAYYAANAGFDINIEAKRLEKMYMQCLENG